MTHKNSVKTPCEGIVLTHRPLGAQLLQASVGGASGGSLLYLSPLSAANASARGGVPVLFPQFADTGPLPKHGFVRNVPWQPMPGEAPDEHDVHAQHYRLTITPTDFAAWPHACALDLAARASPGALRLTLQVANTGASVFGWTGGLHPYFAVDDLLGSTLLGLDGATGVLRWNDQPFEHLYPTCAPLRLRTATRTLEISASGFTQWMVWNPGSSGAPTLPAGDWRRFVCIEPVCVIQPVVLAPGERFVGELRVKVL